MSLTVETYRYRARDPLGKPLEGTIEATSLEDARQQLRQDGFHVLHISPEDEVGVPLLGGRVSKTDVIYLTAQLAIMVDTGITLSAALAGIIEQEPNPALRRMLTELQEALEAGEDFSAALARYPHVFDQTYRSLIRTAEATGTLGPMLDRIAVYLRKQLDTRAKVRAALAYPAVMMVLACGVTIFLLTYVMPKFTPLFRSRGTELPAPTKVMMAVSDAMLNHWQWWIAGAVLLAGSLGYLRRTQAGRRLLDWLRINSPIIGPMYRKVIISRSIRTLGTMLANGVPIMDAIKMAGDVAGNWYYQRVWEDVLEQVAAGKRICEVLRGNPLFPHVLVQMIASGEESGRLDHVLERVSAYYDSEVEVAVKAATSLIEPLMIAAMGVIVGTIGLALLLPIFSLSRQP